MKKWFLIIGAVCAVAILSTVIVMGTENRAISYEESIENTAGDIRVQEKRRFDLLPNLVDCVKNYDKHEYETLRGVIAERGGGSATDVEEIKTMINVVAERYPELKSQSNYKELMNEMAITENKIAEMRKFYNKEVTVYKRYVRQFPSKQILSIRGYEVKDYERLEFANSSVDAPTNLFD